MQKKWMALMLTLALLLSLGGAAALAAGDEAKQQTEQTEQEETAEAAEEAGEEPAAPAEAEGPAAEEAGGSAAQEEPAADAGEEPANTEAETGQDTAEDAEGAAEQAEPPAAEGEEPGETAEEPNEDEAAWTTDVPEPDAAGTVSFANVRSRMLSTYYPLLALQENIDSIEGLNYEQMEEKMRNGLNSLASSQWTMAQMPFGLGSMASASLQPQYDSLREQYDKLKKGELQEDNAGIVRQLKSIQDQTVVVGESLYMTLKGLEAQDATLSRTIEGLNRTVKEMELRYSLGQISALQLQQVKTGRSQAVSGQQTLRMNIDNVKMQLKAMLGVELDGSLSLGALPKVARKQLDAMDVEKDLARAEEASYELFDAKNTLKDARKEYYEKAGTYGENSKANEMVTAKHTWQAAQYTYENTVQSYELKFRTLCAQVQDYDQALSAARTALKVQQSNYAASELKYSQGNLSQNGLAAAKDDLAAAQDTVSSAERDLFSAYRSYCWAVERGILN